MTILIDLLSGIVQNFICLIFYIAAFCRVKKEKHPWGLYIFGLILQSIGIIGLIGLINRNPNITFGMDDMFYISLFVCFSLFFFILIFKEDKANLKKPPKHNDSYTCSKCGRLVAWGQKCDCSSEQTVIAPPPLTPENDVSPANIEESFVPSVPAESPGEEQKVYDPLAAPEKKPGMISRVVAIVSTALCIVFIVISLYFGVSYGNALSEISDYKDRTAKYVSQIDALKEQRADYIYQIQELEEFNNYSYSIGFMVSDDDYMYYHRYNCDIVKNAESYQCHNNEFCKFLGAEPCPECHKPVFHIRPHGVE